MSGSIKKVFWLKITVLGFIFWGVTSVGTSLNAANIAEGEEDLSEHAQGFQEWLSSFELELDQHGLDRQKFSQIKNQITYLPDVIRKDRKQAEFKLSFSQYEKNLITPEQIKKGKDILHKHKVLLSKLEKEYQIDPEYVVALWGVETRFGKIMGNHSTLSSLATLAYEGRRHEFFKKEFITAMQIMFTQNIEMKKFKGSWAGAMGQVQFMPSSIKTFGVDYDGDGIVDLWTSDIDILASASNYLYKSGWKQGYKWGREVQYSSVDLAANQGQCDLKQNLITWHAQGIKALNGQAIPHQGDIGNIVACLVIPDPNEERAFLVYDNFHVITKWNRSYYFALTVGELADAFNTVPPIK